MAQPTRAQLARARALLDRAASRFAGAEAVVRRDEPSQGEFDNSFDGVVSGIFHIVDAFELATTGLGREMREADQATRIASVVTALRGAGITDVPASARLVGLNARRNTSVHGEWLDVLDRDELDAAVRAGQALLAAVQAYFDVRG
ncbi:MAG: hypothetical protein QG587_1569 [Chloroflexota bacterium]|nr:hypothetical protein [Chloroflexota bacterium]